jgi:hypothetical protein
VSEKSVRQIYKTHQRTDIIYRESGEKHQPKESTFTIARMPNKENQKERTSKAPVKSNELEGDDEKLQRAQ